MHDFMSVCMCPLQGVLAELRRDEDSFQQGLGKELREAEAFLEGIEKRYHLPDFLKWLPFKLGNLSASR